MNVAAMSQLILLVLQLVGYLNAGKFIPVNPHQSSSSSGKYAVGHIIPGFFPIRYAIQIPIWQFSSVTSAYNSCNPQQVNVQILLAIFIRYKCRHF
jgi:hypothetical protein